MQGSGRGCEYLWNELIGITDSQQLVEVNFDGLCSKVTSAAIYFGLEFHCVETDHTTIHIHRLFIYPAGIPAMLSFK